MLDSARQSAFEILFGHEPLTSANSEQDASEALRQSAELVAREFDGVRESPPVRGELAAEISSSGDRIRAAAHVALTEPEPLLRVVMQGKTMAGKSTLLEALSCGDGGRRGEGGQRTSREVEEREVTELPGVVLVDVPGVGAADGEDDREKALAQISRADVVLWVATNEAPKNDTADALRRIAMLGKPVIVAINCRQSLDQPPHRDRFLANPEALFARAGELAASVERHLKGEGNSSIAWNALHADAAFRALSGGPDAEALRRSSGIDQLLSLLGAQLEASPQRRFIRKVDAIRAQVVDELARLEVVRIFCWGEIERRTGKHEARRDRLTRVLAAHQEAVQAQVRTALEQRRHWYNTVDLEKDVQLLWDSERLTLNQELSNILDESARQLANDLRAEDAEVSADWAGKSFQSQLETKPLQLAGMGSVWANWGVKALIIGAGVALAIPTGGQSMGLTLLLLAGSTVFSTQSKRLLRVVDRKLPNAAERVRRRRKELARTTHEVLDELLATGLGTAAEHKSHVQDHVRRSLEEDEEYICELQRLHSQWSSVAEQVLDQLARFDLMTAKGVLRIVGRRRAADAVVRASRSPRLAMLVEVDERSYSELALFPPCTVEVVVPTRGGVSVSASTQAILAAPGLGLVFDKASEGSIVLIQPEAVGDEELERMAELLTRFSRIDVSVVANRTHAKHHKESQ